MESLGDSSQILESNLGILDAIESKYITAKDYKNKPSGAEPRNPNSLNLGSGANSAAAKWLQENPNDPRAAAVRAKAGL